MAERGVVTNKTFLAKALAMQAGTGFDRPLYVALDKASMASLDATSNALGSEATESGVARAAATLSLQQTTIANDTCRVYKSFAVGATVTIYGAGAFTAASNGNMMAFHEWPSPVNLISGDTVNETMDLQDKVG